MNTSNFLSQQYDILGEKISINLCDQLDVVNIRRCRFVKRTVNHNVVVAEVDLIFEFNQDENDLESILEEEILNTFLTSQISLFVDPMNSINTLNVTSISVVIDVSDENEKGEEKSDKDDYLFWIAIISVSTVLTFLGMLFGCYKIGHHYALKKHGANVEMSNVVAPSSDNIKKEAKKEEKKNEDESPVMDLQTGEQYRVRAISKHTNLEEFMNQRPSRKTKIECSDDGGGGGGGVKKAWI